MICHYIGGIPIDNWARAIKRAEEALKQIARQKNTDVETVRKRIQVAIISGMTSPDPAVQEAWSKIPRKGEYPTPEEVIAYAVMRIK